MKDILVPAAITTVAATTGLVGASLALLAGAGYCWVRYNTGESHDKVVTDVRRTIEDKKADVRGFFARRHAAKVQRFADQLWTAHEASLIAGGMDPTTAAQLTASRRAQHQGPIVSEQ